MALEQRRVRLEGGVVFLMHKELDVDAKGQEGCQEALG